MSINLIIGCMFSGKTSELIRIAKMNKLLGKNVLIINFDEDRRYTDNEKVCTHDRITLDCFPCGRDIAHVKIFQEYIDAEIICINEGQFFDNLLDFCLGACSEGKEVHICGLDGDYLKRPFGEILNLIPHCESVQKLTALCLNCKDGTKACFTKRICESTETVLIGSTESYVPVCRKCYLKK